MSLWRQVVRGFRGLIRPDVVGQELHDEVEHFFGEALAELERRGLAPAEARRRLRLERGDPNVAREQLGAYGWEHALDALLRDIRYAGRRLRLRPGSTALTAITLALGIGASTAIFSAIKTALLDPLPYPAADRIVTLSDRNANGLAIPVAFGSYREVAQRTRAFEAVAVARPWQPTLPGGTEPERLEGERVSAAFFQVLGVPRSIGVDFDPSEDVPGGRRLVVLSHSLWVRRFAADTALVGREIRLEDNLYTVAGVMPPGFGDALAPATEIWSLLQYDPALPSFEGREWGHHLRMVGRLRRGVVIETAASELADIGANPTSSIARPAWAAMQSGLDPVPLREAVAGEVRPLYLAVFGAVLLLLGIACANVVGLMLAGAAQRAGELGLAAALGASRMRLVQQILTERLLLSALGGAMGLAVAWLGARGLSALAPAGLPGAREADLDGGTLLFAFGLTTLIAAAIALFPALTGAAGRPQAGLRTGSGAAHRFALRRGLVVSEVAVAMVLLVGAGLLLRSVERLFAVPTGFESERVLALQVQTWGQRYQDDATRWGFFDEALEAVRDVPGVVSAAWTSQLPLSGQADVYGVFFEGDLPGEDGGSAFRYAVSPGYLETMRIPILRGQAPEHSDVPRAPVGVLVNESFARQRFGDGDPIGERLHFGRTDLPWYTVMGVVGDVRQSSLAAAPANAIYVLHRQWYFADPALWMVARVREETPELTARVKQAIWSIDASQPVLRAVTMEDLVTSSEARRRFALIVFEAFAGAALVLAQVGLYGVLSAIVVERTREIGVRSALGATGGAIVALVLRQGALLTCAGVTVGLAGAAVATRALGTLLFGVSPLDPWTYGGVVALLVGVGVLAAWLPARRAARVDPVAALKAR